MKLLNQLLKASKKKAQKPKSSPRPVAPARRPKTPAGNIILNDYGDYRRPDDPPNVVRVDDIQPKGFPRKLFEYISVSGVSYRQENVAGFIAGRARRLSLRREFVNDQHPNALAVYGLWQDAAGEHTALLGYVPREVNDAIGDQPVAATLEAMYLPLNGHNAGLKIDIWSPRNQRK